MYRVSRILKIHSPFGSRPKLLKITKKKLVQDLSLLLKQILNIKSRKCFFF